MKHCCINSDFFILDGDANLEQTGDVMAVAGLLKLFLVSRSHSYSLQVHLLNSTPFCIRSLLEYSCQVFHTSLPLYLSDEVERILKRVLKIIFPNLDFKEAIARAKLGTLFERRETFFVSLQYSCGQGEI